MATIVDQDSLENPELEEGLEYGNVDELDIASPKEENVAEVEESVEEPEFDVPAKFKNKGLKDIIQSYEELEREYGRRSNEIGELRKITDEILKSNLQVNSGGEQTASKKRIEVDDLLDNPDEAIESALNNSPRLKQLEEQLIQARRDEKRKWFEGKHPDAYDKAASPEFQEWVAQSNIRQQLLAKAHQEYDYDVASELLTLYDATHKVKVDEAKAQQSVKKGEALKAAITEKGSTGQSSKKIFRRADVLKMMRTNPDKYNSPTFQEELMKAYQEGRVR